jgi:hypothetical protein
LTVGRFALPEQNPIENKAVSMPFVHNWAHEPAKGEQLASALALRRESLLAIVIQPSNSIAQIRFSSGDAVRFILTKIAKRQFQCLGRILL